MSLVIKLKYALYEEKYLEMRNKESWGALHNYFANCRLTWDDERMKKGQFEVEGRDASFMGQWASWWWWWCWRGEPGITNSLAPVLPASPCRDKSYRHILGKLAVEHCTRSVRSSKKNCDPNHCVYQTPAIHEASSDCLKRSNQS